MIFFDFSTNNFPDSENLYFQKVISFVKKWQAGVEVFQIKTSGSTGAPKLINIHRSQMEFSAKLTSKFFDLNNQSRLFCCLNVEMVAGMMMLVRAMVVKGQIVVIEPVSNPFLNIHSGEKFDFAAFVPLQFQAILENNSTKNYLINQSSLKNIIVGGATVNDWILSEIATINKPIYGTYGMTETVSHVAIRPLNGIRKSEYFTKLEGVQLDVDERDCLKIKAECTRNQWIQTHDIVELTNEKFKLLGRANRVVNSGGVKIYLDILEKNIENDMFNYLNKNVRYFLFGEKDEKLGEKLVLVVEAKEPEFLLGPSIIFKNTVSEKYKLPQKIYYVTNFIETNSGKIDYLNSFRKIACN